jgi:hypothetical protein
MINEKWKMKNDKPSRGERRGSRCLLKVLGFLKLGTGNWERGTMMGHKMHKAEGCGS